MSENSSTLRTYKLWWRRCVRFCVRHGLRYVSQLIILILILTLLTGGAFALWVSALQIPDFSNFQTRLVSQSTKIYDRTGKILLYDTGESIRRTVVPADEISLNIKNATVAIEDANFYQHHGVEPLSLLRAFWVDLRTGHLNQGGSTISQQVIKNSLLTPEKAFSRKIKEIVLALKMERVLTKEQILGLYLNESPYGGNLYGVEEASLAYFGKHASDLDLAEAAYLAALPNAPTYYSPYGNHVDALVARKNLVLTRMAELGFITATDESQALSEQVHFDGAENRSIKAPHFVMYVKNYLEQKYGSEALVTRGLKVTTSLNWDMQEKAEEEIKRFAPDIEERFKAHNMGVVGVDPKTGQILLMVGSRDYFDVDHQGNFNVTIAHRQPGSTFKPFVYATGFMKGYTPDTVLFDLPTQFNTNCTPDGKPRSNFDPSLCYQPEDYELPYHGPITVRNALAQSVNIPAIQMLYLVGAQNAIDTAHRMGIHGLDTPERYGLSLVLGGGEVSPLDMTEAYSVFANDGKRNPEASVLKVEDQSGNVLEEWQASEQQVIEPEIARQITNILTDNNARAPAFGASSALYIPEREVAVKTGTTNNYRDVWIVGYTPSISLGFWAGNNDNTPIEKKIAGFVIAPVWNALMHDILPQLPPETFPDPNPVSQDIKPIMRGVWQGGQTYTVDKISGALATADTPPEDRETRVVPDVHSILYWVDKNDPTGPPPAHPETDPQFANWEAAVRAWAQGQGYNKSSSATVPTTNDIVHTATNRPSAIFDSPQMGTVYHPQDRVAINIRSSGTYPLSQVTFYFNNVYIGSNNTPPFNFSFVPQDIGVTADTNTIKAVLVDSVGNKNEVGTTITIAEQ